MAKQRPALDATHARKVHDDLLDRVTTQQEQFGILKNEKSAREFLAPIMRKVEVDHEESREKDTFRPAPELPSQSGILPEKFQNLKSGATVITEDAGEYEWNLRTDKVTHVGGPKLAQPKKPKRRREGRNAAAARKCFAEMWQLPEWRARVDKVMWGEFPKAWKEQQYRQILKDYVTLFGDPRKPRDRKLVFGGK